jgi:hypothetical protein
MKVHLKFGIKTYSGTVDEMTFGSYRNDNICIGREFVYPTLTENNHALGNAMKNLAIVYRNAAAGYKADFKTYATRYGAAYVPKNKLLPGGYSLFIKMMYAWYDSDPTHVDLSTVTIADITALDADVRSIARAVEAGYLPYVNPNADLVANIV